MFSGIVEGFVPVTKIEKHNEGLLITLDLGKFSEGIEIGESISVNGVCLTVVSLDGTNLSFVVMPETLKKTNLGNLKQGIKVNFERSLRYGDRIGGHFVYGHVDGTGTLESKEMEGEYEKFWIKTSPEITDIMIEKGSVALDGVSMTVVDVNHGKFSICLIPHTLEVTTLGEKQIGDIINIEVDQIGKWIQKFLGKKIIE